MSKTETDLHKLLANESFPLSNNRDSSPFEVVPLREEHLPDAAALFAAGYRQARRRVPSLPARHEDVGLMLPKLRDLAGKEPGVVAIRSGRVVGFLLGQVLAAFRGKRTAYSPEWAHAAEALSRPDVYRAMYAAISSRWVDDGCLTHLITALADQQEVLDAFFRFEFGMMAGDAMRDLSPVRHDPPNVEIRRASASDADAAVELVGALERHMAAAPVFFCDGGVDIAGIEQRLADPKRPAWLAHDRGEPVGYMHIQPGNPSAAYVISDAKTASIRTAITKPSYRGRGIGAALLARAIDWARSAGYERCSVDFEPQNIVGCRFWLKHFQPVCYSMIRHVDERIGPPGDGQS